jgi:hypothetical protein
MSEPTKTIDLARLKDCFPASAIEWRAAQCGKSKQGQFWCKCLAYITSRHVMDRLDEVCGPANWRNEFTKGPDGGVLCGLSIRIDGEWVTKWDGADGSDIEKIKGGISDAQKRAAVQWGIGRYLYDLEEGWAEICDRKPGAHRGQVKDSKEEFWWVPPKLPDWALPKGSKGEPAAKRPQQPSQNGAARSTADDAASMRNAFKEWLVTYAKAQVEPWPPTDPDKQNSVSREMVLFAESALKVGLGNASPQQLLDARKAIESETSKRKTAADTKAKEAYRF